MNELWTQTGKGGWCGRAGKSSAQRLWATRKLLPALRVKKGAGVGGVRELWDAWEKRPRHT